MRGETARPRLFFLETAPSTAQRRRRSSTAGVEGALDQFGQRLRVWPQDRGRLWCRAAHRRRGFCICVPATWQGLDRRGCALYLGLVVWTLHTEPRQPALGSHKLCRGAADRCMLQSKDRHVAQGFKQICHPSPSFLHVVCRDSTGATTTSAVCSSLATSPPPIAQGFSPRCALVRTTTPLRVESAVSSKRPKSLAAALRGISTMGLG